MLAAYERMGEMTMYGHTRPIENGSTVNQQQPNTAFG